MAAILSVTYTPAYSGCHRICFKTSQASYCCYQDNSPSQPGTQKITDIDLDDYVECLVDLPLEVGCEGGSNVDGYVQPCCTDAASLENRVPFTAVFSTVPCTSYRVECEESGVGEIQIINAGYGWPIGVTPNIIVNTTGSGSGFVATATMNCLPGDNFCSIDDIDITDPGLEYFYINQLSVSVSPLPTCISNELVTNGDFPTDLSGWTLAPSFAPNIFIWYNNGVRYNLAYANTTPGFISQDILTPGKTYEIRIDSLALGCTTGYLQFIVSAGDFDISGTQPNQFNIFRTFNDPVYTTPIFVTLTCVGSTSFNIYAYTTDLTPAARLDFDDVSVIEVCTAVNPELDVIALDDCGTFTVPECNGDSNPTQYDIFGTPAYAINVCSGGAGPVAGVGGKYNITPNPPGVSCCDCIEYNVVVRNPIDIYYTDCNQNIVTASVEAGAAGLTICGVLDSIFPVIKTDNSEILAITNLGSCP